jgi:acetylornithine/succinyldiaminopimelate/putrescine aminotransferase
VLALRAELSGEPYRLVAARDGRLLDQDGRWVDDLLAGWGTQPFGHRPREVEEAVREFLASDAPSFHTSSVSPLAGRLARKLCERTGEYSAAFFANGGAEAVEAALKLCRAATGRSRILHMAGAFHGCTLGCVALMEPGDYRDAFGPSLPDVQRLEYDDVEVLVAELRKGDVAAVVLEPIQVESGLREPRPEFLQALGEETQRHGTLIVADEIMVGLGRTGRFLATEGWPRRPDVVTLGKALGGGVMPISCMLTRRDLFARAYGTHTTAESHGTTFGGNALSCVAALKTLELLDDDLLRRVREKGERLAGGLRAALQEFPLVSEVRAHGLVVGIRLEHTEHPWFSFEAFGAPELRDRPAAGMMLCHRLYRAGFLVNVGAHDWNTVRLHPALDVSDDRVDAFVEACRKEVEFLCRLL